jgi:malto-oligosyltrehalose synthase
MSKIPRSTYRLQFNRDFTFAQATEIVPYLAALGISHCYASPYLRARPGSMHGYDIIDHHHLNPEIGTAEEYDRFVAVLHEHGMGQILDIVPNHMGIMGSDNEWWLDVLENGESSNYADFFDIDWEPLKDELQHKVLIPVLSDQYGTVLERSELRLVFDPQKGEFSIWYFQHKFPINPREYPRILGQAAERMAQQFTPDDEKLLELQSLISAFSHLPGRNESDPEKRAEQARDKEIHKRRLAALCERSREVAGNIARVTEAINGIPSDTSTFDHLHELIKAQAFRLAHWRVAADDINYRRFFDVNELAALRQEHPEVFATTHEFILQLVREGKVDGLRVDHPDGLYDPQQYFERLQAGAKFAGQNRGNSGLAYVVAEKILNGSEQLPDGWPIDGTTGYEFSSMVNGLFVNTEAESTMTRVYAQFTGEERNFRRLAYECRKLVMDRSLNSELNVLANHLSRIALSDRHTCDFTLKSLRDALTEIVACFPVYRTYVSERQVSDSDGSYIEEAVECARQSSGTADLSVFDFIRDVLLVRRADERPAYYQRSVIRFAMKFQQYTSAVMAKGLEDTAFYRYNRLVSLNDVGGDPLRFGTTPEEFHKANLRRQEFWPYSMLAGSTHDSKRSEDVRARINVLSEMPEEWSSQVLHWWRMNRKHKRMEEVPSPNDEYLFYQSLLGCWPMAHGPGALSEEFVQRMCDYMVKALRETKQHTSWAKQNEQYEQGTVEFVQNVLASGEFREEFGPFQRVVEHFGMLNSLGQMLLKICAPGVPDTYQGNDVWEFSLVDPDNRRVVDYESRKHMLCGIQRAAKSDLGKLTREAAHRMHDGRIKMYVLWQALHARQRFAEIFQKGGYLPLEVFGQHANNLVAFGRVHANRSIVAAVPRLSARLLQNRLELPLGEQVWQDTAVAVPHNGTWHNLLTGETVQAHASDGTETIKASELFAQFPVALLSSQA